MSVTVYPAKHAAQQESVRYLYPVKTGDELFQRSCKKESEKSKQVLRSSFEDLNLGGNPIIGASSHGFVSAVFKAYCGHRHLIIRPEDVWFAILTQLSFYINANAEELRYHFVAHEGQKEVIVEDVGTIHTVDIGRLAVRLTDEMDKFIVDRELKNWILPNFTTTTHTDTVVAAVIMMGTMQAYFKFAMALSCGIPSVTLLGTQQDWASIRLRLDRLASFGEESQEFGRLLIPVLDNFIQTFDSATVESAPNDFWGKICHREGGGSGPSFLSGWITAFCFWNEKGKKIKSSQRRSRSPLSAISEGFDTSVYPQIDTNDIPNGFTSVPVKVDDNGKIYLTRMVAGSVGLQWSQSDELKETLEKEMAEPQQIKRTEIGFDTIKPILGWWMYEPKEN